MRISKRELFGQPTRVVVEALDEVRWRTIEPISYGEWTVPAGFVTDFLSIPRVLSWLAPRYARYTPAGILHDWLLETKVAAGLLDSTECDQIFRDALGELDTPTVKCWLMWTGVRWGAAGSKYRRAGWWSTAPRVLLITVVAFPFLVLPVTFDALALVFLEIAERLASKGRRGTSLST